MPRTLVSIVVPTHNEQANISPLYRRIENIFESLPEYDFELIFADDSNDSTATQVQELHASDPRVKLVSLRAGLAEPLRFRRASGALQAPRSF